jgi:hypothetical protein
VRYFLCTLGLLVLGAGAAGYAGYRFSRNAALAEAASRRDTMAWLRTEFHLDPARYAAIVRMHRAYDAVCARHCQAIMAAEDRHATPAEIGELKSACVRAMTGHFRRVAAMMPPGEGARYLAIVLPRIADYDHRGPPTLRGTP